MFRAHFGAHLGLILGLRKLFPEAQICQKKSQKFLLQKMCRNVLVDSAYGQVFKI